MVLNVEKLEEVINASDSNIRIKRGSGQWKEHIKIYIAFIMSEKPTCEIPALCGSFD